MHLSQRAIDEFKKIYEEEYGEEISDAEARDMGTRLLRIFMVMFEVDAHSRKNAQQPDHSSARSPKP